MFVGGKVVLVDVVDGSTATKLASSKSHLTVKAFNGMSMDVRQHAAAAACPPT